MMEDLYYASRNPYPHSALSYASSVITKNGESWTLGETPSGLFCGPPGVSSLIMFEISS